MKTYIPHQILIINASVVEDPVLMECIKRVFDWANTMGLEGKRVFGLHLKKPSTTTYEPMRQHSALWCHIECEKEQREAWEEMRGIQIKKAVKDMLKE